MAHHREIYRDRFEEGCEEQTARNNNGGMLKWLWIIPAATIITLFPVW